MINIEPKFKINQKNFLDKIKYNFLEITKKNNIKKSLNLNQSITNFQIVLKKSKSYHYLNV